MDKDAFRQRVWDRFQEEGIARFPFPPHGRIPNFEGAQAVARQLTSVPWWEQAETIKCNPDAPQRPVREQALEAGKTVVMAQPRLRSHRPFIVLDPATIAEPAEAATIGGAEEHGMSVGRDQVPAIDGIVVGSVAVDTDGRRIGKGEGYSDLEFACLLELGAIKRSITVATTVHDTQMFDVELPAESHDVPLDYIATPTSTHQPSNRSKRPDGLEWALIDDEMSAEIPLLSELTDGV